MAATAPSKAAIDRAGKRLRDDAVPRPEDVALYDQYRASLGPSLEDVARLVAEFAWPPHGMVGMRLKRPESVIAKLRRGNFRLSGLQDIAGCRLVVENLTDQDQALAQLGGRLNIRRVDDYRTKDHISGYRAVHMIVRSALGGTVEVQVRTDIQNRWAVLSERLAQMPQIGGEIKYGGGPRVLVTRLDELSRLGRQADEQVAVALGTPPEADEPGALGPKPPTLPGAPAILRVRFEREIDATMQFAAQLGGE